MAGPTSSDAVMGRFQTRGSDFLHFIDASGNVMGGIDRTGAGFGTSTGGLIPPPSKILFVDMNRFDSYTPNGCVLKPFRTITDAVNQIISNGDNSISNIYCVFILPGAYSETIVLENPALVSLVFMGIGAVSVSGGIQSQANNSNLQQVDIRQLRVSNGSISLSGSGSFLSNGLNFYDCYINLTTWTETGGGAQFFDTSFQAVSVNLTNVPNFLFMGNRGPNTGTSFTLVGSTLVVQRGSRNGATVSIDATSTYIVGNGSRQDGAVTVNGAFNNRGIVTGAITVNAGGSYNELGAFHTGSLTLNGGSYTQTGILGVGSIQVGGVRVSTGLGTPNGAIVGSPGDVYLNTAGGSLTTLWVKESGVATNSGWIGK